MWLFLTYDIEKSKLIHDKRHIIIHIIVLHFEIFELITWLVFCFKYIGKNRLTSEFLHIMILLELWLNAFYSRVICYYGQIIDGYCFYV